VFPPGREAKTICRPSGEKRGAVVAGPPKEVNWTGFEPSALQVQISRLPERSDTKAMLLPSGEYAA
jgi:hypothetical protein